MYQLKCEGKLLLERPSEPEIYDVALQLAERNLGTVLTIHLNGEELSRFTCTDAPQPKYWAERAVAMLNGGPMLDAIGEYLLDSLPTDPHWVHWTEIH